MRKSEPLTAYLRRPSRRRLARVVHAYSVFVWETANRVAGNADDAEDIAQDVFLKLLLHPQDVPSVRSPRGFFAWRILDRASRLQKSDARRRRREAEHARQLAENGLSSGDLDELRSAIRQLPDTLRTAVELRFLAGLSSQEAAATLQVSERTMQRRLERGRAHLRQLLSRSPAAFSTIGTGIPGEIAPSPPPHFVPALLNIAKHGSALGHITAAQTGAAKVAALGGILVMKKTLAVAGVGASLAIGWALLWEPPPPRLVQESSREAVSNTVQASTGEPAQLPFHDAGRLPVEAPGPSGRISGGVYDSESGQGIAGVELRFTLEGNGERFTVQTGPAGQYAIPGLGPGQFSGERRSTPGGYRSTTRLDKPLVVELEKGESIGGMDFHIAREALLGGKVIDIQGRAISGAEVRVTGGMDIHVGESTESGEDGRFTFHGLSPTEGLYIQAVLGEWSSPPQELALAVAGRDDLELTIHPGASVFGTVVDGDGRPLPGMRVSPARVPTSLIGTGSTVTDHRGEYALRGLPPGTYRLVLRPADEMVHVGLSGGTRIALRAGEEKHGVRLLYEGVHSITGQVVDTTGAPVRGAEVDAGSGGRAVTDADGRFAITGMDPGFYDVEVDADTYRTSRKQGVAAGRENVTMVLQPGQFEIRGRVLSEDTGDPVPEFELAWIPFNHLWWSDGNYQLSSGPIYRYETMGDPDGAFVLPVHMYVNWTSQILVIARAQGFATGFARLDIRTAAADDVTLRLRSGGTLRGVVVDRSGNPIANAMIFYERVGFPGRAAATSGSSGEFTIESFPQIDQKIAASLPGYAAPAALVPAAWDRAMPFELVLGRGGIVAGRVQHTGKGDASRVVVTYDYPDHPYGTGGGSRVESDGTFQAEDLIPGNAKVGLSIRFRNGLYTTRTLTRRVLIEEGSVSRLDFDVPEANGIIRGRVLLGDAHVESIQIQVEIDAPGGTEEYITLAQSDGRFELTGVLPGSGKIELTVQLQDGGTLTHREAFELDDGGVLKRDFDLTGGR